MRAPVAELSMVGALCASFWWCQSAGGIDVGPEVPPPRQDGRFIERLEWTAPHGEQPTSYAQYLQTHPLRPAVYSRVLHEGDRMRPDGEALAILVDAGLHVQIQTALDGYVSDLESEGHLVLLQTVDGGAPAEIKDWVHEQYDAGYTGVLFVGDITAAWAQVEDAVFPCDLFYMDLDGHWEDGDGDGVYDIHLAGDGDEGPELFVARMYASSLTYATEAKLVSDYLAKAHAFRVGELTQPWRALEYVEEDWYAMDVNLDEIYGEHVVRHDFGYLTTATDYLDQMDLGQHFVQVCAHSYSGGHHFGTRPTEAAVYAHVYVHSLKDRAAHLQLGADDGLKVWLNSENVLTKDRYGEWTADEWIAAVDLDKGWNRFLCKISQGGGGYQFSARITYPSGEGISDLTYQLDNPETHGADGVFVRTWLVNGFHEDSWEYFWQFLDTNYLGVDEASINPDEGDETGGKTWEVYGEHEPFVDLLAYHGLEQGVCYAFARVYAEDAVDCQLWLGYDDGLRAWLNGEEILYDNRHGGFIQDMTKLDVSLGKGSNRLLLKVSQRVDAHGFSARFCDAEGHRIEGLMYDPAPAPVGYLGRWLLHGPYQNGDEAARLSMDYIGGEADVAPSADDVDLLWEIGDQEAYPFDIGVYYDHGGWVLSQDIQDRDPPVLFYNLFACGPGRFVDQDYLAGAYIFNTTYGLITVASSKSGSMLNFIDFTTPLGQGKTIGTAFKEWFDAQAPFEDWERGWYYGMVVNGDPILRPMSSLSPADINGDGVVDVVDLVALLGAWGPCEGCPEDIDGSGVVDALDLLILLGDWG